jgi:cyanamide hydratase
LHHISSQTPLTPTFNPEGPSGKLTSQDKKKTIMANLINTYGFTAVPASAQALLTSTPVYPPPSAAPIPILVSDTPIPNTPLGTRINAYAKAHLPTPTYNHSLRVYHFGLAIKRHRFPFPDWDFSDETYFLACALHDIGTTEENIQSTRLSFEFAGGYLALDLLQNKSGQNQTSTDGAAAAAPRDQAESVAEAIIRHQDLCTVGKITAVGQLLQLATIFGRLFFQFILAKYIATGHPNKTESSRLGIRLLQPYTHCTASPPFFLICLVSSQGPGSGT